MNFLADSYRFRARIIPEFLSILPIFLLIAHYVEDFSVLGFLSLALFFILFQGNFSGTLGRKLEKKLQDSNQLMFSGQYFIDLYSSNPGDKIFYSLEIAAKKANLEIPFEMEADSAKKKEIKKITDWLINRTREQEKFPAVFDKLCEYGYYRNMLALRYYAIGSMAVAIAIVMLSSSFEEFKLLKNGMWLFLIVCWIVFWTRIISLNSLVRANENYLQALFAAVSGVEPEQRVMSQEAKL